VCGLSLRARGRWTVSQLRTRVKNSSAAMGRLGQDGLDADVGQCEQLGVKVGDRVGSQWIITDGLHPAEMVVAEGVQKIRQGIQVSPKPMAVR